jgi:hypothetical protein
MFFASTSQRKLVHNHVKEHKFEKHGESWRRAQHSFNKGLVSHSGLAICIKKYLKAKEEELWKLKIFHHAKNILFKKSSKRNQKSFEI